MYSSSAQRKQNHKLLTMCCAWTHYCCHSTLQHTALRTTTEHPLPPRAAVHFVRSGAELEVDWVWQRLHHAAQAVIPR